VDEALDLLARHGEDSKLLAGGQSLVPMMNMRLVRPAVIVDLNRVAALGALREEAGGLRLGALVRQHALERDGRIAAAAPLLAEAAPLIGQPADPGSRHHRRQPGPRRPRRRAARLHDRPRRRLPSPERPGAASVPRAGLLPRPPGHRARARRAARG